MRRIQSQKSLRKVTLSRASPSADDCIAARRMNVHGALREIALPRTLKLPIVRRITKHAGRRMGAADGITNPKP